MQTLYGVEDPLIKEMFHKNWIDLVLLVFLNFVFFNNILSLV